jgi:hypothetical protein
MNASGHTLNMIELIVETKSAGNHAPVYVAADGAWFPVERVEVDGAGITLYCDNDPMNLADRVDALETVLRDIADSNDKGSKMTKAEIIAAALAVL